MDYGIKQKEEERLKMRVNKTRYQKTGKRKVMTGGEEICEEETREKM